MPSYNDPSVITSNQNMCWLISCDRHVMFHFHQIYVIKSRILYKYVIIKYSRPFTVWLMFPPFKHSHNRHTHNNVYMELKSKQMDWPQMTLFTLNLQRLYYTQIEIKFSYTTWSSRQFPYSLLQTKFCLSLAKIVASVNESAMQLSNRFPRKRPFRLKSKNVEQWVPEIFTD
jgi:hypothetical protein